MRMKVYTNDSARAYVAVPRHAGDFQRTPPTLPSTTGDLTHSLPARTYGGVFELWIVMPLIAAADIEGARVYMQALIPIYESVYV